MSRHMTNPAGSGIAGDRSFVLLPMQPAQLILADLSAEFGQTRWFTQIGAKPTAADRRLASDYFAKLGLKMVAVWLHDLGAAVGLLQRGEIDAPWEAAEREAEARLTRGAVSALGAAAAHDAVNRAMLMASDAAMAAARTRFAEHGRSDEALLRVAAGGAGRAAAEYALVQLAGADPATHPFAAKFRLFGAGRWPLVAIDEQFGLL